jgi:hypothetical protein
MVHDPTTCPFCGDLTVNGNTGYYPEQFQVHTLAKLAELESRVQDIEWRNMPLGPGKDVQFDEERLDAIRKVLGKQAPDCPICYDEEGSWACIRAAHGKMKNV